MNRRRNSSRPWSLALLLLCVAGHLNVQAGETINWSDKWVNLQADIAKLLEQEGVPGVSVALIAHHQILAVEGFGVTNRYFPRPVTPGTIFEVGSVGKAVAAYGVLALVDQGVLDLDLNMSDYLQEPWLPEQQISISVRQVLSHSSGLSDKVREDDRHLYFTPGERYQYSGMGFLYLQTVLEQHLDQTVNSIMVQTVFKPLSMTSASYDPRFSRRNSVAWGHTSATIVPMLELVPASLLFALLVYLGRKRNGRPASFRAGIVMLLMASGIVCSLYGVNMAGWKLFSALTLVLTILTSLAWASFWLGKLFLRRFLATPGRASLRKPIYGLWVVVIVAVFAMVVPNVQAPVPGAPIHNGVLAWSLHCTAGDLAKFVVAVVNDRNDSNINLITQAQIEAPYDNYWGLGLGLGTGSQGRYLYHTGNNPGFRALILAFPDTGDGLVVLANGDGGEIVAERIAKQLFGHQAIGRLLP